MLKKIKTREKIEKEKKRNQIIVGVVMIGILVLSTAGFALLGGDGDEENGVEQEYNGFRFFKQNNLWELDLGGQKFHFKYLPQEVENVSVLGFYYLELYSGKPLYFVDHNPPASSEILNNIARYVLRYQEACLEGLNCPNNDDPNKTCEDNLIIFLEEGNETKTSVYQNQSCVYISGDFIRGADAFLYKILGIK